MKILKVIPMVLALSLGAVIAWGEPFMDDFNRPDSAKIGNDWTTQQDGTITVEIIDQEVLISGVQGTDWVRSGLSRTVEDETKIYFDFLAGDNFNVHIRIDDTANGSYMDIYAWPGGPFSYASSLAGEWPGWTQTAGPNMISGQYNTLGVEQDEQDFTVYLNENEVEVIENENFLNITKVLIASDSATGTVGSLHIDNVIIGDTDAPPKAVKPSGKAATVWGKLKDI
jgi:hypothetical protein